MDAVLRAAFIYTILLMVLRFSGRRTIGQISAFEFVLLLIVAEATQNALLADDSSLTNMVIVLVTLFAINVIFSYAKGWSRTLEVLLEGQPTTLIRLGEVDTRALARARVTLDEIMASARLQHGLERIDQIRFAVLEASGTISIVPKPAEP